jgi:hypothetical protein
MVDGVGNDVFVCSVELGSLESWFLWLHDRQKCLMQSFARPWCIRFACERDRLTFIITYLAAVTTGVERSGG